MNHDIKFYKLQKYIIRWSKNINDAELLCIELYTRKTGENLLQKNIGFFHQFNVDHENVHAMSPPLSFYGIIITVAI